MNHRVIKESILQATGMILYIFAVSWLLFTASFIEGMELGMLAPFLILLLFVISVAVMGLLMFGRAVLTYLGGNKQEAIHLVLLTLAWLILFALIAAMVIAIRFYG